MQQSLVIGFVIVVLAGILIYSLINRSAGWLRMLQVIFYSIVVILSTIIYYDAYKLNEQFFVSDNTLLLEENGQLFAGMRGQVSQAPTALDRLTLGQYQTFRDQRQFAEMRGDSFRLFIFDAGAFWDLQGNIQFGDVALTRDEAVTIQRSGDPLETFANIVVGKRSSSNREAAKKTIRNRFTSAEELKAKLLSAMIAEATRQQGKAFVPNAYRNSALIVEPRTPYFLFVRYAPEFIVDMVVRAG